MTAQWAVTYEGKAVSDLAGLAGALGTSREGAAKHLLADRDLLAAAPVELQAEAKAKFQKGGGDKPPQIANGSFVSWSGGKGRVDLIVTNGKVPGVEGDVEGSTKTPAARVVVYEDDKPTRQKIAKSTHVLKRIPPIGMFKKKSLDADADPYAVLIETLAEYDSLSEGLPAHARVSGRAVKSVFDRGVEGWPGEDRTDLSPAGWAIGRVEHFLKVAAGDPEVKAAACHDTDLLDPTHPRATEFAPEPPPPGMEPVDPPPGFEPAEDPAADDLVVVDAEFLDAQVKSLLL